MLVQILDIGPAEVAAVQNKADAAVVVGQRFINQEFELTAVIDGSRIELVEQWYSVRVVESNPQIEDWSADINF